MSICFVTKNDPYELKDETIVGDVLTMTWGEERYKEYKCYPAIVQLLVNKGTGPYLYEFSDWPVNKDTILTITGLPPVIQSIQMTVI